LTQLGADVLKGQAKVNADEDIFKKVDKKVSLAKKDIDLEHKDEHFEALRELRKEIADEVGVPPYIVFSDKTLKEMASVLPQDDESFLDINGVGQVKLERYGKQFIEKIRELV